MRGGPAARWSADTIPSSWSLDHRALSCSREVCACQLGIQMGEAKGLR